MLQNQLLKSFVNVFRHIQFGSINITMPDGKTMNFSGKQNGPCVDFTINNTQAIKQFIKNGDIGLAESYRDGLWESSDLASLFLFGLKNEASLHGYFYGSFLNRALARIAYLFKANTINGSKKNIHAHYDLGNCFYKLWLDPSMTYSSAVFEPSQIEAFMAESYKTMAEHEESAGIDLTTAQHRKYDRIIENLNQSGRLLEIGCGWGGFAERALEKNDYGIKGITISKHQHSYAMERLNGKALIASEDYRIQSGKYDNIVSIEMFEAVGEKFWPTYFNKVKSLLSEKGKAIIQTITIDEKHFENYRKSGDPIRTFIFPGGMLPSKERFIHESKKAGLSVQGDFSFGEHYALTLSKWLETFEQKLPKIKELGFDDMFIRMWRFYLTFCIASFKSGRTNVMQMQLGHQ